jgi:phosphoesterase RecJ-like protein
MARYGSSDWDDAVTALRSASEVAIGCHVHPDGDALGSLLAATLGLAKLGKRTHASWGDPNAQLPPNYGWLPGADRLLDPKDVPPSEVWLALDCGAGDRLGELEDAARASDVLINVDHHTGNDNFGDLNIVAPAASSTAEIVTYLLRDVGVELDRDIAVCLYTGIVTDTGRFQYSNASPDTLRLAADLLALDVPAPQIALDVFESYPFAYLKLLGRVLDRAVLCSAEGFVYSYFTRQDLEDTGVGLDQTDGVIDCVRSTSAADVAAIFKEQPDGRYRVSMRSKGPISVGRLARAREGGGHELAAGFTSDDIDATVETLRADIRAAR